MRRRDLAAILGALVGSGVLGLGALARSADVKPLQPSTVVVAMSAMPETTDPFVTTDQYSVDVEALLYDPLWYVTPALAPAPDLATAWSTGAGGRVLTVTLSDRARWTNGRPVVAADVVYSLDRYRGAADRSPVRARLTDIASVAAPDAHTVVIRLVQPRSNMPLELAGLPIVPAPASLGAPPPAGALPSVTDGPYRLVRWNAGGGSVTFAANAGYFRGAPHVPQIVLRVVPNAADALPELRRGSVQVAALPPSTWVAAGRTPTLSRYRAVDLGVDLIAFDSARGPFDVARLRTALALATDRGAIVARAFGGMARVPAGILPPVGVGASVAPVPYDPAQARAILAGLGWILGPDGVRWRDGRRLAVTVLYPSQSPRLGEAVREAVAGWQAVGVAASARGVPWSRLSADLASGRFQAAAIGVAYGPALDAAPLVDGRSMFPPAGDNVARYDNPVVDALLAHARTTASPALALLDQAQALAQVQRDHPYVPLAVGEDLVATTSRLSGFVLDPAGPDLYQPQRWMYR